MPATTVFQTKGDLALTLLQRAQHNGALHGQWVTGDAVWGSTAALRAGVDAAGALVHLHAALERARTIGHRERICLLLINLTAVSADAGQDAAVLGYLTEGLKLVRTLNQPWLLCAILEEHGEFELRQTHLSAAAATFGEMETVARAHTLREYQAAAFYGQAHVALAQGHSAAARSLGEQSQVLYAVLEHPRQQAVAAWLTTLPSGATYSLMLSSTDLPAY